MIFVHHFEFLLCPAISLFFCKILIKQCNANSLVWLYRYIVFRNIFLTVKISIYCQHSEPPYIHFTLCKTFCIG